MRIPHSPPEIVQLAGEIKRPLWSVMIPAYNCFSFLSKTIESVLRQDPGVDQMQIEVVDDCSSDADIQELVEVLGKGRISYFRQNTNKGSLRNFESCIRRAKGHYVHILHGDDIVHEGYYSEVTSLFEQFPQAGAAFTNFNFIDQKGENLKISNQRLLQEKGIVPGFLNQIAKRQLVQPPAMTVKRETYEKIGGFYAVMFGEDWEMWARIASLYPVAYSPKCLAAYRVSMKSSLSFQAFLNGTNIHDLKKVINIIQGYVPTKERPAIFRCSSRYYSIYNIRIANSLLSINRKAALNQVKGALTMNRSAKTLYWAVRFYLMYFFHYKEIKSNMNKILSFFVNNKVSQVAESSRVNAL